MSSILNGIIHEMKPKPRRGRPPVVTPCPYCGASMAQTGHRDHRSGCKANFKDAPAQTAEFDQTPGGGYNSNRSFPQT